MTTGTIIHINKRRGMCVVQLANGSYSVLESSDIDTLEIDTIVKGNIEEEGSCKVLLLDASLMIDVIVQNAECSLEHAMQRAKLL